MQAIYSLTGGTLMANVIITYIYILSSLAHSHSNGNTMIFRWLAQTAQKLLVPVKSENMRTSASVAVQGWLCTLPSPVLYIKLPLSLPLLLLLKLAPPPACMCTLHNIVLQESSRITRHLRCRVQALKLYISEGLTAPFQATEP